MKFSIKLCLIFLALIVIFNVVGIVYTRYESRVDVYTDAKIAYFITEQKSVSNSIMLSGLEPRDEPYLYTINIYNYDDIKRCDVDLEYTIEITTTTNLPLSFMVIKNQTYAPGVSDIIDNRGFITGDDGVYYQKLLYSTPSIFRHTANQMDQYTIVVNFPKIYNNNPDVYQGKIDLITFTVKASQLV